MFYILILIEQYYFFRGKNSTKWVETAETGSCARWTTIELIIINIYIFIYLLLMIPMDINIAGAPLLLITTYNAKFHRSYQLLQYRYRYQSSLSRLSVRSDGPKTGIPVEFCTSSGIAIPTRVRTRVHSVLSSWWTCSFHGLAYIHVTCKSIFATYSYWHRYMCMDSYVCTYRYTPGHVYSHFGSIMQIHDMMTWHWVPVLQYLLRCAMLLEKRTDARPRTCFLPTAHFGDLSFRSR